MNSNKYLLLLGVFALANLYLPTVFAVEIIDPDEVRCFTNDDLADALSNGRCWIIVEGKIYDVTNSNLWASGSHLGCNCGDSLSFGDLRDKNILFGDLIDYYGDVQFSSRVGKLCELRTIDKPNGCGNSNCNTGRNENFRNCPQDCPPKIEDGYCVPVSDFICDPDCGRRHDPDCICNRNLFCEVEFENHVNCPGDCPPDYPDGFCFLRHDGVCDPDCAPGGDPDCTESPGTTTTITATTVPQGTLPPATVSPTTVPPITVPPTTISPATVPPTTVSAPPTTVSPTTVPPTTVPGSLVTTTLPEPLVTTTLPQKKQEGIENYLPYTVALLVVILVIFLVHRKLDARRIKGEREEFRRWKEERN